MKTLILTIALLLFAGLSGVQADTGDLYAAEVRVSDDTLEVRNEALKRALQQVLVRLSGSAEVGGHPGVGSLLERAPSLVQQFRYRLGEVAPGVEGEASRFLWARFDKASLDRSMRGAGIPVWGARRPRVLLWLASEQRGARQLVSLETDVAAREALMARARERGMPLQLPLVDLLDQSALSAADLWAGYEAAIREASERYPHDAILTGRLRDLGGRWEAQWTLLDRAATDTFKAAGSTRSAVMASGIDAAQDLLSARYAPASSGEGPGFTRVRVRGVDSVAAYGRLMAIIRSQELITRTDVRGTQGDDLFLDIWVRGGQEALNRMLSLGGELYPAPAVEPEPIEPATRSALAPTAEDALRADLIFDFYPSLPSGR